jgi:hypothetical protein
LAAGRSNGSPGNPAGFIGNPAEEKFLSKINDLAYGRFRLR